MVSWQKFDSSPTAHNHWKMIYFPRKKIDNVSFFVAGVHVVKSCLNQKYLNFLIKKCDFDKCFPYHIVSLTLPSQSCLPSSVVDYIHLGPYAGKQQMVPVLSLGREQVVPIATGHCLICNKINI